MAVRAPATESGSALTQAAQNVWFDVGPADGVTGVRVVTVAGIMNGPGTRLSMARFSLLVAGWAISALLCLDGLKTADSTMLRPYFTFRPAGPPQAVPVPSRGLP